MQDLLSQLRNKTSDAHHDLESLLYSTELRNGTITIEQYTHLLNIQYIFFEELESQANKSDNLNKYMLSRAELAKKDLEKLGSFVSTSQSYPSWRKA